jgi:hypothetical protein
MRHSFELWLVLVSGCLGLPMCEGSPRVADPAHGGLGGEGLGGEASWTGGGTRTNPPASSGGFRVGHDPHSSGGSEAASGGSFSAIGGGAGSLAEGGSSEMTPAPPTFPCLRPMGAPLTEHACLHAQLGPFLSVGASQSSEEGPPVDQPHTAYELASAGAFGWVRYRARSAGYYAVFLSPGGELYQALPKSVPVESTGLLGLCELLGNAWAFSALADQDIWLEVSTPHTLVIEAMSAFGDAAWGGECGCALPGQACGSSACCGGDCVAGVCPRTTDPVSICAPGLLGAGEACAQDNECCSGSCMSVCVAEASCRSSGPCTSDSECCLYCHDSNHCH